MAHNTTNRRQTIKKKLSRFLGFSSPVKGLTKKNIFRFINKEEDEDNEQTLWPFSGKTITGRLGFR